VTFEVHRNITHPWSGAPGWDVLTIDEMSAEELTLRLEEAKAKFWQLFFRDPRANVFRVSMCKPASAAAPWSRPEEMRGTPKDHGKDFKVGDEVWTDYDHGRISMHKIAAIETKNTSQTGIMLRVTPAPRGSGYVPDDPGRGPNKNAALMDSAWFRRVT
jgi:hypothetical protein